MNDRPVLKTPGEMLLAARKGADLQLDQVSERTKIPVAILRALENDQYHKISGSLYVNSFMRTYAVDVGLDPAEVLEVYMKFSGEVVVSGSSSDTEAVWVDQEVQIKRVGVNWTMIGVIVACVVVLMGLVLWLTGQFGSTDEMDSADEPESEEIVQSLLAQPVVSSLADSNIISIVSADSMAGTGISVTKPDIVGAQSEPTLAEPEGTSVSDQGGPELKLPSAPDGVGGTRFQDANQWSVVLRLICKQPVDVKIVRDGERDPLEVSWPVAGSDSPVLPFEGIVYGIPYRTLQGLAVYWGARDQFSLKLGRTEDVEISINGEIRDISNLQPDQEIILFVN